MAMIPKNVLISLLSAIFGTIIFIAIETLIGTKIEKYLIILIIGGITLIVLAHKIKQVPIALTRIVGSIILFIGMKPTILKYITQYPYYFLIGGIVLMLLSDKIADLFEKNGI